MTGRAVKEWVGKTADTAIPPRVRVRVFLAKEGKCHRCRRSIRAAIEGWICEHIIALINWVATEEAPHGNRESNLDVTCQNCKPEKDAEDVAIKSAAHVKRKKHILPKGDRGERRSGFRRLPKGYRWDWSSGRGGRAVKI